MKALEIPITSLAAHFMQETEIFKKSFFLEFEWIEQESFWLLHIFDQERQALSMGLKLIPSWPLYTYQDAQKPFAFMLLGKSLNQDLTRLSLSQSFTLVAYETF